MTKVPTPTETEPSCRNHSFTALELRAAEENRLFTDQVCESINIAFGDGPIEFDFRLADFLFEDRAVLGSRRTRQPGQDQSYR